MPSEDSLFVTEMTKRWLQLVERRQIHRKGWLITVGRVLIISASTISSATVPAAKYSHDKQGKDVKHASANPGTGN